MRAPVQQRMALVPPRRRHTPLPLQVCPLELQQAGCRAQAGCGERGGERQRLACSCHHAPTAGQRLPAHQLLAAADLDVLFLHVCGVPVRSSRPQSCSQRPQCHCRHCEQAHRRDCHEELCRAPRSTGAAAGSGGARLTAGAGSRHSAVRAAAGRPGRGTQRAQGARGGVRGAHAQRRSLRHARGADVAAHGCREGRQGWGTE